MASRSRLFQLDETICMQNSVFSSMTLFGHFRDHEKFFFQVRCDNFQELGSIFVEFFFGAQSKSQNPPQTFPFYCKKCLKQLVHRQGAIRLIKFKLECLLRCRSYQNSIWNLTNKLSHMTIFSFWSIPAQSQSLHRNFL